MGAVDPDCKGFVGGYAAGQWAYLLPRYNGVVFSGKIARVKSTDFKTVEVLDLGETDKTAVGFYGGFATGSHGYLVPNDARIDNMGNYSTKIVRFNLAAFGLVEVLDLKTFHPDLKGFQGSFVDKEWAYLVPNNNGVPFGKVTRVNVLDFKTVQYIDLMQIDPLLRGYNGGFTDGVWGYLVPYKNNDPIGGDYHGKLTRINLTAFGDLYNRQQNSSLWVPGVAPEVQVLDLVTVLGRPENGPQYTYEGKLRGFSGGFQAWGFAYLVPLYLLSPGTPRSWHSSP